MGCTHWHQHQPRIYIIVSTLHLLLQYYDLHIHTNTYTYTYVTLFVLSWTIYTPLLSIFTKAIILLRPDAHQTHQHEIRNYPLQWHTCSHHHVQPRMTTRPQQRTVVTPNHPRPLTTSNTAKPLGPLGANRSPPVMDGLCH